MAITLRPETVVDVVRLALRGVDHRVIVHDLIDALFVDQMVDFLRQVVDAKWNKEDITLGWYREHFLDVSLPPKDIALNAGINEKTIQNKRKSKTKEIVLEEAAEHFDKFEKLVEDLIDEGLDVDLALTFRDVTVHLTLNETLIVVNALAVRRANLRGGVWSTAGKQVEVPLMEALCHMFSVNPNHFTPSIVGGSSSREVDYYLQQPSGSYASCEVKLMGAGNPESADGAIARDSRVFVASTLSNSVKRLLDGHNILWTELQADNGFLRFGDTLAQLGIPHTPLSGKADYSDDIERAIQATFGSPSSSG